ncbi:hypothetical protein [Nonlabens tegetincola]|uniref:hypothetical protein n=1 Tax=Nonlabens tegetincola TaxID=323273 RepID=UPI000CF3BB9D|nr:hypothetical protein [Nonlabens tegetincola]PQJ18354.1 hypothetical protein BST93_07605 [Nonlabens tegetincola]
MNKLITLLLLLVGSGVSQAEKLEDHRSYNFDDRIIFVEGGIEFAVFPDGQFDFNFLDYGPQSSVNINTPNINISFNTGYDYDRYVQYDNYGAVIQVESVPIYYDGYGRIIQAGDVFINYRNGWVNRVGSLSVFYNRPGVIVRTAGFINPFNRVYVYRPWHRFYAIPIVDRCIVWNNPYRLYYNPIRFSWNYHRTYWRSPNYYNGCFVRNNVRRNFYRPNDRVRLRSFERGRRDSRGRAIASNNRGRNERAAISRGRTTVNRTATSSTRRSNATRSSNNNRNTAITGRSSSRSNERATRSTRSSRNTTLGTTNRNSRVESRSNRTARITNNSGSNRSNDRIANSRSTRTNRVAPARSNRSTRATSSNRSSRPTSARSTSGNSRAKSTNSSRSKRSNNTSSSRSRSGRRS